MRTPFLVAALAACVCLGRPLPAVAEAEVPRVIFDTDITGDCDDVLALAMCHTLADRNACELLAVTVSKDNPLTGPFVDAVNTFYGRPDLPVGVTRDPDAQARASRYLGIVESGVYPHDLRSNDTADEAVSLLRRTLAAQPDGGVTIVSVGTATNLAGLLRSPGDALSPLAGPDLVRRKVALLAIMAGSFADPPDGRPHLEANVINHVAAMRFVADTWPDEVPIRWSGYEIGIALPYPRVSIAHDYASVPRHIVREAYLAHSGPDHDRPCWDQSSVLDAVFPHRGYFGLSQPGRVAFDADGRTRFTIDPDGRARDRHLVLDRGASARALEAIVQLSSQPPMRDANPR
ncbi:MAG: nucleoside hydrolase [Planctomycetia bacterium]|nr:nucleoside hydrolase [Planctomycetia bacterium]